MRCTHVKKGNKFCTNFKLVRGKRIVLKPSHTELLKKETRNANQHGWYRWQQVQIQKRIQKEVMLVLITSTISPERSDVSSHRVNNKPLWGSQRIGISAQNHTGESQNLPASMENNEVLYPQLHLSINEYQESINIVLLRSSIVRLKYGALSANSLKTKIFYKANVTSHFSH